MGMRGIGENTLTQYLYNDPITQEEFDIKAWVSALVELYVFKITKCS